MKKKLITTVVYICCLILIFIGLHITPNVALRTHVFMMGYPVVAFTTTIEDDNIHKKLQTENTRFYKLNIAPVDRVTGNNMTSYKVTKKGFLYFAQYYGEA